MRHYFSFIFSCHYISLRRASPRGLKESTWRKIWFIIFGRTIKKTCPKTYPYILFWRTLNIITSKDTNKTCNRNDILLHWPIWWSFGNKGNSIYSQLKGVQEITFVEITFGEVQSISSLQCSLWAEMPEWDQLPLLAAPPCSLPLMRIERAVWPTYLAFSEHGHWNS